MTKAHRQGAGHALALDADIAEVEPVSAGGRGARARLALRAAAARARRALHARVSAAIDVTVALLLQLRNRAGVTEQEGEARRANSARPEKGRQAKQSRHEIQEETSAPKPRRRLRSLLAYLAVMLAGGMGGMALAYDLLEKLVEHRSAERERLQAKLSKNSKSLAALRKSLDLQQATREEAQTRLAASLAENEKKRGEMQEQRARLDARLASVLAQRASDSPRQADAGANAGSVGRSPSGWAGSGSCTLGSGDVRVVLKDCIADMNRN